MNELMPYCVANAVLLMMVASLLWSSAKRTEQQETKMALELEMLRGVVAQSSQNYNAQLEQLRLVTDNLRAEDHQRGRRAESTMPLPHIQRLAGAAATPAELAELTGLGKAEAEFLMNITLPKAPVTTADNKQSDVWIGASDE